MNCSKMANKLRGDVAILVAHSHRAICVSVVSIVLIYKLKNL